MAEISGKKRGLGGGEVLWEPDEEYRQATNMARYLRWLEAQRGLRFGGYEELWRWSVTEIEDFWQSVADFFAVRFATPARCVLEERRMPGARWFAGAELNYAEHVFRNASAERPALLFQSEHLPLTEISWAQLARQTAAVAAALRRMGVGPGDRVVSYMPNIPQTVVAFLACASIGAVWSSCSPDFGVRSVADRFRQIAPKVMFAVDGYRYGGRVFDCRPTVASLAETIDSLEHIVQVPYVHPEGPAPAVKQATGWAALTAEPAELSFARLPFDHPLWVVYSSGTTGLPKALVHGHGGILMEFLKFLGLHLDLGPADRFFWFSTTGWVMWNILQGSLLTGATALLYDGSPGYPDMDVLWEFAERSQMTFFGTSAAYITACMNAGLAPGAARDLCRLRAVGSTGSPLPPEGFRWVYEKVNSEVLLGSVSGGTDPCTAFLGCCPLLPVRAGELQCRCLGVNAQAFDEAGNPLVDEVGELVITEPMPSMPLYLWNDPQGRRYRESYFEMYPGKWRHGDWVRFTPRGSGVILGRSDSTINRQGVRMGSSEIYAAVEELPEVADSLVVGYETPGGQYRMPLFVVPAEGVVLDAALGARIKERIRSALSPRHVPDEIVAIAEVPYTLNGKKLEVPVKRILSGEPPETAVNPDAMRNPQALEPFVEMARRGR